MAKLKPYIVPIAKIACVVNAQVLLVVFSIFLTTALNGQLISIQEKYPGIISVKSKSCQRGKKPCSWLVRSIDSLGNMIKADYYQNRKLEGSSEYIYNDRGDIIKKINTLNIIHPQQGPDTSAIHSYSYNEQGVILRCETLQADLDLVTELTSDNDGTGTYTYSSYITRSQLSVYRKKALNKKMVVRYTNDGQRVLLKRILYFHSGQNIARQEYYPNGLLKRVSTEYIPPRENRPGSGNAPDIDEKLYEYDLYRDGRVKRSYIIFNGGPRKLQNQYWYKKARKKR